MSTIYQHPNASARNWREEMRICSNLSLTSFQLILVSGRENSSADIRRSERPRGSKREWKRSIPRSLLPKHKKHFWNIIEKTLAWKESVTTHTEWSIICNHSSILYLELAFSPTLTFRTDALNVSATI